FHARSAGDGAAVLQIRGFGVTQPIADPMLVTMWRPILANDQIPAPLASLVTKRLAFLGHARFFDGSRELLDLAGTGNPQLEYCERYESTPCALVWVSDAVRTQFREGDRTRELATLDKLGIALTDTSPVASVVEPPIVAAPAPRSLQTRYDELVKIASGYALDGNVQRLRLLAGDGVKAGFSDELGRTFLRIEVSEGNNVIRGLVLVPGGTQRVTLSPGPELARQLDAALAR